MDLDHKIYGRLMMWLAVLAVGVITASGSARAADTDLRIDRFVREAVANELAAQQHDGSLWQFRETKRHDGKTEVLAVVETKQCALERVVALNGEPLDPALSDHEDARIEHLISDHQALQSERHKQDQDFAGELRLLRMLPNAFIYEDAGESGNLIKLNFKPNPAFRPPNRESEVFHHMEGTIWFDVSQKRLARLSGHLTSEVKFGWGVLGRLAKGGTFFVEQQDVGKGHWELTRLDIDINGKILMFKTIDAKQTVKNYDFKPVPQNVTLQQAAQMAKRESGFSADNTDAQVRR